MSLRLIYGRSGTGKTTYILNEIKQNLDKHSQSYIITPEQFSYSMEKELLDTLNKKSVFNAEVITFNRMSKRLSNEVRRRKRS